MVGTVSWHARVTTVLRGSPVFGLLDEEVLAELVQDLSCSSVAGGTLVVREGDVADSVIIVVSGRLRVWREGRAGELLLYNEIGPGESVGEPGLLLQQARTANVTALRDSTLAILSRPAFESLLSRQPLAINRVFSQALYNYLRHSTHGPERSQAQSYVLVPLHPGSAAQVVARELVQAFGRRGRVCHVDASGQEGYGLNAGNLEEGIGQLDELESGHDFLIYEAEAQLSPWTRQVVRHADQVIFVAAHDAAPELSAIEARLAGEPGYSMKRKHLVLLHPARGERCVATSAWRNARNVERVYPLRSGNADDFARLGRFLTGTAVGLVLGGGGARGFAHLGVLKALEESGIPVDLIGGNSMGALIGAQYVLGTALDEIRDNIRAFAAGGEIPALPAVSLLSGRRMERNLKRLFGDITIDALWRPFFAAACNLSHACTTVQDNGMLWRAVLASNSPAGLLPPVVHEGNLLVDGAILDNVPVAAMRVRLGTPNERRRGNGFIIAVDVDVRDELSVDPDLERLSAWRTLKGLFGSRARPQPGIGSILYRAGHIGSLLQRERTVAAADFYLEPPVSSFALMGYRRASEIAEVGYRYALAEIERWDSQQRTPR